MTSTRSKKTVQRWTKEDEQLVLETVRQAKVKKDAIKEVALKLNKNFGNVSSKYYALIQFENRDEHKTVQKRDSSKSFVASFDIQLEEDVPLPTTGARSPYLAQIKQMIETMPVKTSFIYKGTAQPTVSNLIAAEHRVSGGKAFVTKKLNNVDRRIWRLQ